MSFFIEKVVCVEPKYLNENLLSHLRAQLKKEFIGKCDEKHGYISDIGSNIKIVKNKLSRATKGVFFHLKFGIKAVKPKINQDYEGEVCIVFEYGILANILGKIKVLIPKESIQDFIFSKGVYSKGEEVITKNSKIIVNINKMKYENQNFECIGNLKRLVL